MIAKNIFTGFINKKGDNMTDISFGSTYRIPISQAGVNSAKKARLKELIESYPNGLIGKSKVGNARVSMLDSEDASFIAKLKKIGYKVYQKFEGENIPKEDLDIFIKEKLDTRNFSQKGKSPERLSRGVREKRRFERGFTPAEDLKVEELDLHIESDVKLSDKGMPSRNIEPEESSFFSRRIPTPDEIRQSENYLKLVEEEGKEFAEAVYFGIKK